jgi:hypothetical protein
MQRLNAIDAISPAFTRTHALLFKPFRVGRSWKLTATSYLAWAGSFFFPFPLLYAFGAMWIPGVPHAMFAFLWAAAIAGTIIYFALFYCFVRLQLVDFEMVVTLTRMIAPMWRKYSTKVWPWIGVKVLVGIVSAAIMIPVFLSYGKEFLSLVNSAAASGPHPDPQVISEIISSFFGIYFLLIVLFLIPKTLATLLDDFVLPFFLLEDLPLLTAIQRGFTVFAADPVSCILYLLLKLILAVIGYMMQAIAMQICMIPVGIVFAIVAVLGSLIFRHAGPVGYVLGIAGAVVLGLAAFAVIFYISIGALGYLLLLLDAYALYFLGGRYPLLGNLLEPGPGAPFTPPPVFPSSDERKDSDGGPPMPMNPAVA